MVKGLTFYVLNQCLFGFLYFGHRVSCFWFSVRVIVNGRVRVFGFFSLLVKGFRN